MHKSQIPRKPAHVDLLTARRRDRYFGVKAQPAGKMSFRHYWRRVQQSYQPSLKGKPRKWRRAVAKIWWRADLRRAKLGQSRS